ncbi:MAG TPA: hypothetical protein VD905_00420, partial [Flavobacteriales bacterium]|nr:hypothetical protein [Flavobacteriales bacterium]
MKNKISTLLCLAFIAFVSFEANAQRSFRYRFHYNHTHDTLVFTKTKHYKKYQITKTGANTGIYKDWYKKGGGPLSEIHYEIIDGKIEHRTEKVFTRSNTLETYTVYDTVKPYNIESYTRTEYHNNGKKKTVFTQKNGELEGPYAAYTENETVKTEGSFKRGFKNGIWKEYNAKGTLNALGSYTNQKTTITATQGQYGRYILAVTNSFTGLQTSYEIASLNCRVFDSLDAKYQLMVNGNINFPFTYYHKHGRWFYFDEQGDTAGTEYYVNGELAEPDKKAQFAGGYDSLKTYLKKNIKNPITPGTAELNGRVYVNFIVRATGALENIEVEERWADNVKTEALRIIAQMPVWEPALVNGKPVQSLNRICLVYQPGTVVSPLLTANAAGPYTGEPNEIGLTPTEGITFVRDYGDAVVDGENINAPREEGERVYTYSLLATDGVSENSDFY